MKAFLKIFIILFSISIQAQHEAQLKKIDSLLNYLTENSKFMGQVALRENGKIIFEKGYGFSNLETKQKANANTIYKIGSISKTFTAVMIMQLIEERKLKLETSLAKYYPQIKNAEKITISHLLYHRTGIKDFVNADSTIVGSKNYSKEEMLTILYKYDPLFEPNAKYEYSNTNYYLLGRIIEDITKKDYKTNCTERIINKIQLTRTTLVDKIDANNNEAYSYNFIDSKWTATPEWDMSIAFGAGGISSSASDITKFTTALFNEQLVKKSSLDEMTKINQSYGKGLIVLPFGERKFYGHTGGIEGFRTVVGHYPAENFSIALYVNGDNYNRNDIMLGILSIYYKMPFQFPNLKTVTIDNTILNSYVGTYTSKQLPLKIEIRNKNGVMEAQATGQGSFTLNAISNNTFVFDPAGIKMIFEKNQFTLKQGGGTYLFTRE